MISDRSPSPILSAITLVIDRSNSRFAFVRFCMTTDRMNELPVIEPLRLRKGGRFYWCPKRRFLREIIAFSLQFYYTWIKICRYEGSVSFCWNYHEICHEKYRKTPCVRSVVKSSSHNGLKILQSWPGIVRK